MFYDYYLDICAKHGVAPTSVLTMLGISKSTIANWKNGSEPSNRTKKALADYFGITVTELMSGEIKEKPAVTNDNELSANEREFTELVGKLSESQLRQALDYAKFLLQNQ